MKKKMDEGIKNEFHDEKGNIVNVKQILYKKGALSNKNIYEAEDENGNIVTVTKEIISNDTVSQPYYIDKNGSKIILDEDQLKNINLDSSHSLSSFFVDEKGKIIEAQEVISNLVNTHSTYYEIKDKNGKIIKASKVIDPKQIKNEEVENKYNYIDEKGNCIKIQKIISTQDENGKLKVEDESGNIITVTKVFNCKQNTTQKNKDYD